MKRSEDDLELHIHQVEERLAARRSHLNERMDDVGSATRSLVLSPAVLTAAASVGFALAQMTSRRRAPPQRRVSGVLGLLAGAGMTLLKMRYGNPASWIGNFLASRAR
jgi:hypothetical protein